MPIKNKITALNKSNFIKLNKYKILIIDVVDSKTPNSNLILNFLVKNTPIETIENNTKINFKNNIIKVITPPF